MDAASCIVLIVGVPGAGKSTLGRALAQRMQRSVCIEGPRRGREAFDASLVSLILAVSLGPGQCRQRLEARILLVRLGASVAQLAIAWVLAQGAGHADVVAIVAIVAIVGADRPDRITDNLAAARLDLSSATPTSPTSSTPSHDLPSLATDTPHRSWPCWGEQ